MILNFSKKIFGWIKKERANKTRQRIDVWLDRYPVTKQQVIVVYFSAGAQNLYQLNQWVPVFNAIDIDAALIYVFRKKSAYKVFSAISDTECIFLPYLNNLSKFYSLVNPKVIFYVDNTVKNFQSLIYSGGFHVHLNHGESDKVCMETNQVKAYDYAIVCGKKAIERYRNRIPGVDITRLIPIGRPQLDVAERINFNLPDGKYVVTYAPTWEGDRDEMAYTSVESIGYRLVKELIDTEDFFVFYKPHPKLGVRDNLVKKEHHKIISLVSNSDNAQLFDGDVISLLNMTDLLISDVSSVVIDFLAKGRPYWVYTPEGMPEVVELDSVRAGYHYNKNWVNVGEAIMKSIFEDHKKSVREEMQDLYFDTLKEGDSLKRFNGLLNKLLQKKGCEIGAL